MTWQIIGHERAVRTLQRAAATAEPAHAYLVTGPEQVGKRTLARELAAALNCEAAPAERPCHACRSCRMIFHEAHPDVVFVERAEGKMGLEVEQVRDAREQVAWRPYEGRYKVYVFVDAGEMQERSANAFLLALEEPPPQVVFVLTASQPESLLPTVLSRCRPLPLHTVPSPELAEGLQRWHGAEPAQAQQLAALAAGQPGWAVQALANPDLAAQRVAEVDRAISLSDGALGSRLLLAAEACKGDSFVENRALCLRTLVDMQVWWRDLLLVASGSPAPLVHEDRRAELLRQAERRGTVRIARGLREIEATAGAVERNVTPRLALEALLLRLA